MVSTNNSTIECIRWSMFAQFYQVVRCPVKMPSHGRWSQSVFQQLFFRQQSLKMHRSLPWCSPVLPPVCTLPISCILHNIIIHCVKAINQIITGKKRFQRITFVHITFMSSSENRIITSGIVFITARNEVGARLCFYTCP